jgi:2-haloacid dehalogenase
VALLVNMAKHARLPWDCVLSAELFRHYKPDREAYLGAAALLGLEPREVMLVAAHKDDLHAARACGLRTAFVPRLREYGPAARPDASPEAVFDYHARDFLDLARQLARR